MANKDNFTHPIGSLSDANIGVTAATALATPGLGTKIINDLIEPWWSPETSANTVVKGTYGKTRHGGNFGSSNPYAEQLAVATNNQDKDALYEKAVNWEADHAALLEQRAYDSPVAQVARQRAAGINPDLQSSGGSGGISSGSSAVQPQTQGQTKMSNAYDNTQNVLSGIDTAVNAISSFTGAYTGIVGALDTLATQHSRINLNDAQANLANTQANEANQLLEGKKKGQTLANAGQAIKNSTDILGHLAGVSQLLSADSNDESILGTIKGLGLSEDEATLNSYKDIVKKFHANPAMQKQFYEDSLGSRFAKKRDETFDDTFIAEVVGFEMRFMRAEQSWKANVAELNSKVAAMLNTDDFAKGRADLEESMLGNANVAANIQGQLLQADFDSLALIIDELSKAADDVQSQIDVLEKKDNLTDFETTRLRNLKNQKARLLASGSEKYEKCFDIIDEINRQTATYDAYNYNDKGTATRPAPGFGAFNQETYVSIYTRKASAGEVVREQASNAIEVFTSFTGKKTKNPSTSNGYSYSVVQ